MTLAKAVEALKCGLTEIADNSLHVDGEESGNYRIAKSLLASLPEPMTEEKVMYLIINAWHRGTITNEDSAMSAIRALREARCLYVVEDE